MDHLFLFKTVHKLQNDTILSLPCFQAQSWVQSVMMGLRQRYVGIIPKKIKQIILEKNTKAEKELLDIVSVVEVTKVFPIVPLGL